MKKAGRVSTKQQVTAVSLECDQEWLLSWRTVLNTMFVEQTTKGLHPTAQGCRTRLPWVSGAVRTSCHFQPRRGCGLDTLASLSWQRAMQPLWGWDRLLLPRPQGSRVRQPLGCGTKSHWDLAGFSAPTVPRKHAVDSPYSASNKHDSIRQGEVDQGADRYGQKVGRVGVELKEAGERKHQDQISDD